MVVHYDVELTYNKLQDTCRADFANKVYGEDYVFLGYMTGGESVVAQLGSNITSVFPQDHFQTPYDDIPMLEGRRRSYRYRWSTILRHR